MTAAISTALAILTISSKKKKGKPNFFQRIGKYYGSIDKLLVMTVAKEAAEDEKRRALEQEFKTNEDGNGGEYLPAESAGKEQNQEGDHFHICNGIEHEFTQFQERCHHGADGNGPGATAPVHIGW